MVGFMKDMAVTALAMTMMNNNETPPTRDSDYYGIKYKSGLTLKQQAKRKARNKMARHSRKMNRGAK